MSDSTTSARPAGPLHRVLGNLLGLLRVHVGLFGIELEEARAQFIKALVLALFGVGAAWLFLLTLTLAAVLLVDPSWRVEVVVALLATYLIAAIACLKLAWQLLAHGPPLFGTTLDQLRRDREQLLP